MHKKHCPDYAHHIREFRNRSWVSLILTIPFLAFSETIQEWVRFVITILFQSEVIYILANIIYLYVLMIILFFP